MCLLTILTFQCGHLQSEYAHCRLAIEGSPEREDPSTCWEYRLQHVYPEEACVRWECRRREERWGREAEREREQEKAKKGKKGEKARKGEGVGIVKGGKEVVIEGASGRKKKGMKEEGEAGRQQGIWVESDGMGRKEGRKEGAEDLKEKTGKWKGMGEKNWRGAPERMVRGGTSFSPTKQQDREGLVEKKDDDWIEIDSDRDRKIAQERQKSAHEREKRWDRVEEREKKTTERPKVSKKFLERMAKQLR